MKKSWQEKTAGGGTLLAKLLANRGVAGEKDFLDPKYENSHDPMLLKDMDKAVSRVEQAINENQKITIYADYDADAVTAAAVLLRYFEALGYKNADYYIPSRFSEGYGVNEEAIAELAVRGTNLVITVDCGINAFDSALAAKKLGIDMIITDHHQLTGGLPEAVAVVNPHRPDDQYPFKDLTGVGVAFKLVQALQSRITDSASRITGWEKWLLDLVAIGTVADCQSLLGENRIFTKWGLVVLHKSKWLGIRKLLELAEIDNIKLDTYHIGFIIAPRINAAGRIEHANLALDLLLTNDENEALVLAEKLEELNRHRQDLTRSVLSEAREQVLAASERKILLAAGDGWPKGVVGLVAGKLNEEFKRPVLVLEKGELEATGSARSIGSFNIIQAISESREILIKYGGHPMAAGFTLRSEHIELFHQQLLGYADKILEESDFEPVLSYEAEISLTEVNDELLNLLEKFAPFGVGNARPRFLIKNLRISDIKTVGNDGKHLRMFAKPFVCIGFNQGFWTQKLQNGDTINAIVEPQYNEWNGRKSIQLKVVDLESAT